MPGIAKFDSASVAKQGLLKLPVATNARTAKRFGVTWSSLNSITRAPMGGAAPDGLGGVDCELLEAARNSPKTKARMLEEYRINRVISFSLIRNFPVTFLAERYTSGSLVSISSLPWS